MTNDSPRCTCAKWQKFMSQIVSAQKHAYQDGMPYIGEAFRWCPWCGKELQTPEHDEQVTPFSNEIVSQGIP